MTLRRQNAPWFALGIALLVVLGLVLRFTNLGLKLYWYDEVWTSMVGAGYTQDETASELLAAHEITPQMLLKYQQMKPGSGLANVFLAPTPNDAPLNYLISRQWMLWAGHSPAAMRALPALISVLALPCLFWLCLELFQSRRTAWLAVGLMSVSPFFVLYAQEARNYSLWTLETALSSAIFLRALKLGRTWRWGIYTSTVALGFLTHYFFAFVVVIHGLYLLLLRWFAPDPQRPSMRTFVSYLVATGVGLLAVSPLLLLRVAPAAQHLFLDSWVAEPLPWMRMILHWGHGWSSPFVDVAASDAVRSILGISVLILVAYALAWLWRRTPLRTWSFVYLLVGIPSGTLILLDLVLGGQRSAHPRYVVPTLVGLLLAVAHLLATQIREPHGRRSRMWQAVTVALLALSLFSSVTIVRSESWWNKGDNSRVRWQVVRAINAAERPLVVMPEPSPGQIPRLVVLGHYLDPQVRIKLGREALADVDCDSQEVFWLNWPYYHDDPPTGPYGLAAEEVISGTLWRLRPLTDPGS